MGWKGTARSLNAAINQANREAERRRRELARQQAHAQKMADIERAALEVALHENHIELLTSVHREPVAEIDWTGIAEGDPPPEPDRRSNSEAAARVAHHEYRPSMLDRALRRVDARRAVLESAITDAKREDDDQYRRDVEGWRRESAEWAETQVLARRVMNAEASAYSEVVNKLDPFSDIELLGSNLEFKFTDGGIPTADVQVHGSDTIPDVEKSQLKSGKLSTKKMTKSRFYQIHQDYVCGVVLRVSNELLGLLPVPAVVVTAIDDLLNTSTGHIETQPILSVAVPRQTMERLNLEAVDPSDAMTNFVHNMKFQKTKGMLPVDRVTTEDLDFQ